MPRDSFKDPSVYDQVSKLKSASREGREQILSQLRLYSLQHPLLDDANSYFDSGKIPDLHKKSTQTRSSRQGGKLPVYEVRSRVGAAWRGGVIQDQANDPWLVHADAHDKFHASAASIFKNKSNYYPGSIDLKLRDHEEVALKRQEADIACLEQLSEALYFAVQDMPKRYGTAITAFEGQSFKVSLEVSPSEGAENLDSAHEALSEIDVFIEIDIANQLFRQRMIRLCLPFLQPNPELREQVYTQDGSTMQISLVLSHAQLAQALVTVTTGESPKVVNPSEPTMQHYFERKKLTSGFVLKEPLRSLCGEWIVPRIDAEAALHLPICKKCEQIEPVNQKVIDLIKGRLA